MHASTGKAAGLLGTGGRRLKVLHTCRAAARRARFELGTGKGLACGHPGHLAGRTPPYPPTYLRVYEEEGLEGVAAPFDFGLTRVVVREQRHHLASHQQRLAGRGAGASLGVRQGRERHTACASCSWACQCQADGHACTRPGAGVASRTRHTPSMHVPGGAWPAGRTHTLHERMQEGTSRLCGVHELMGAARGCRCRCLPPPASRPRRTAAGRCACVGQTRQWAGTPTGSWGPAWHSARGKVQLVDGPICSSAQYPSSMRACPWKNIHPSRHVCPSGRLLP